MADPGAREQKLVQYLNEAYGKEKQLETVLQAQVGLAKAAGRKPLQKRFQEHLKETKAQSRGLERRIKQLGGKADTSSLPGPDIVSDAATGVANVANRALAAAKGPVQALRGTSESDNLLRNIRDSVWNEAEEIAHYDAIEALADALNDKDTAKLAREFRRQEERMQKFLRGQIPALVKAVVREEIPAKERSGNGSSSSSSRSSSSRSSTSRSSSSGSSSRSSSSSSGSSTRKKAAAKGGRKSSSSSSTSRSRSASSSSGSSSRSSGRSPSVKKAGAKGGRATAARRSSGSSGGSSSGGGSSSSSGGGSSS